jgi:hypothetical protein
MCMSHRVTLLMSDHTATGQYRPSERDRLAEPVDAVVRVLRTHIAPVTGLEEEVALILFGRPGWMMHGCEERERG